MTDEQFQRLLDRLTVSCRKHFKLLHKTEAEFERRYGDNPSNLDCDGWIDSFHYPPGMKVTVSETKEWAESCKKRF